MNCGAILLDANKQVIHVNDRAQRCFGEGLSIKNARLWATDRICDALFQTILDQTLKYGERHKRRLREALGLKREDRASLIVRAIAVEGEARCHLDGAALILILVDPEDCPEPSDAILQQVFGLTKSEARVASKLVCGDTLQEIARSGGTSVGTVRSQAKSLFAKTRTNRQADLVALLTRLAMISEECETDD
jgi:DNA-binding CsgD family transcriptional regulator